MTDTPETQPQAAAPGQMLKRARENRNLTVAAIATQMNLDMRIIEALEAGDQSKLPAPIFVRGYLRGYARQVGISEAEVLGAYQAQAPQEPVPKAIGRMSAPLRPAFRGPAIPWRGLLLTVVVIALGLLGFSYGPQLLRQFSGMPQMTDSGTPDVAPADSLKLPAPESADSAAPTQAPVTPPAETVIDSPSETGALELALPTPSPSPERDAVPQPAEPEPALPGDSDFGAQNAPDTTVPAEAGKAAARVAATAAATTPTAAATAAPPAEPAPAAQPAPPAQPTPPGEVRLAFTFTAESWVEVRAADGSKLLFDLMRKGDTREVSGKPPISVLVGNAGNVALRVDGKDFDLAPHSRDDVARFEIKAAD